MKIRNIRFQNISSLNGEYEIDFDRSPLSDSGIFAITGPNGAGKSSILDALTLALYGETPRVKNPGEELISRNCRESSAAVIFSVNDSMYRSQWQIRRKGEKTAPPEMRLFALNGQEILMDEKISSVRNRVAELTGLDFKRFCRSVMLAQGEFAAFLHALDSERSDILEKIIGPEIRSAYAEHTFQKAESENGKWLQLKEETENFSLPDAREVAENREQVSLLLEQLEAVEGDLADLEKKKEGFARQKRLKREYEDAQLALAEVTARQEEMQEQFRQADKARKAAPIRTEMEKLDALIHEQDACALQSQELAKEIPDLETRLETVEERKTENEPELEKIRQELTDRQDSIEQALEITRKIEAVTEKYRESVDRYDILGKEQDRNLAEQNRLKEEIQENLKIQEESGKWLAENAADAELSEDIPGISEMKDLLLQVRSELRDVRRQHAEALKAEKKVAHQFAKAGRSLESVQAKSDEISRKGSEKEKNIRDLIGDESQEELEKEYKEKKEALCRIKKLLKIAKQHSRKIYFGFGGRQKIDNELADSEQKYEELAKQLKEEQNILLALQIANAAIRYESDRAALKDGEPCPLCGSLDHPFVYQGLPYEGDPRKALKDQENKVGKIQKQTDGLSAQIKKLRSKGKKAEILREEWEKNIRNADGEWGIEDLKKLKASFRELKAEVRKQKIRLKTICKYRKKAEKFQKVLEKKKEKISEKNMVHERLQNDLSIQQGIVTTLVKETEEKLRQEEKQGNALLAGLEKYGETIPEAGNEMQLIQGLEERKALYLERLQEAENLKLREGELEEKKQQLPENLKSLKNEAEGLEEQIRKEMESLTELKKRREEQFGPEDPVQVQEELENSIREKTEEQARLMEESEALERELEQKKQQQQEAEQKTEEIRSACKDREVALSAKALGAGFSSLEEVRENMLPDEELEKIIRMQKETEGTIAQSSARLESIREMLDSDAKAAEEGGFSSVEPEIIEQKIQENRKIRDEMAREYAAIEKIMKTNDSILQEYEEKRNELEKQEKICGVLNEEKNLLESGTEAEVRKGVQGFMLKALLKKSNRYLEDLSGHYYIRPDESSSGGMGFEIEDIRHKGTRRPLESLSGGESFLASMSLALGLSEMACSDRKIESLFLDEGFGTLDDETLYKVISTLKNIKNNGKMVGVISHIKRLADEIPTQIRIERQQDGSSRMEVIP